MFRANVPGRLLLLLLLFSGCAGSVMAQRIVDKNKGDYNETRHGLMDGNLVATVYYNFGEVADWKNQAQTSGVWPKGTNHTYVDGVAVIVQAETKDPSGRTIHPLETNYYEYTRASNTGITYGWWPLPGYAARGSATPAQSTEPGSWPPTWPDRPADWNGSWNGFFGKNVLNADLESYFVFDDNEDREYILRNSFHPDAGDPDRGGLGMQVRARGFQWSQVLAEDVIFWYYEITNMGTTDYEKTLFGEYVDWGIGGHDNSSSNNGLYNKELNISYAWLTPGILGSPGNWSPVGYAGYAFLESPGVSTDNVDNDLDGLTDERRDNLASKFIETPETDPFLRDVRSDTARFRNFYGYGWKPHWDADENCNWRSFTDINGNGKWDPGEPLNDDVGSDGIGPLDEGYTGPDPDGTEGNGKPDQGEPNFGLLDKDESDQLGLTGFKITYVHDYDLDNDERNWGMLSSVLIPPGQIQPVTNKNLANFFSSYFFHLNGRNTYSASTNTLQETGETERFSMALIFALNTDDLFRRKRTVQQIYNASYHFAKPPDKATVKAVPGDGRVTLYWDTKAELTFDAFYQKYNFEGYRIYRSTEPNFLENKTITDAYGVPVYRNPIAQYDLVDGVKGLHPIDVNGAKFNLGNDSGLRHAFIDSTVQNGQTYYYAVCAYDQGFTTTTVEGEFIGIPPSETTSIIKVDANGNVKTDINTVAVTPRAPSAGYIKPVENLIAASGPATGTASMAIIDPRVLPTNVYRLSFVDSTAFHNNPNPYYQVIEQSSGDTVIRLTKLTGQPEVTPVTQGFSLTMQNAPTVSINHFATGWTKGSSNNFVDIGFDSRYAGAYGGRRVDYPADFEITFKGAGLGDTSFPATNNGPRIPSDISVKNLTENVDHWQFIFRDNNSNQRFDAGDAIFMVSGDSAGKPATAFLKSKISWSMTLSKDTTVADSLQVPPQVGDVYHIATTKPFRTGEYFDFQTKQEGYSKEQGLAQMQNIAVVPNPYVGAASWEPATSSVGRGPRLVYFIHLPRVCWIRIYTVSGHLVQTLRHESSIDDGQEAWNLVSRDGMDIAYGIYVYHVDANEIGLGTHIDRFAILK